MAKFFIIIGVVFILVGLFWNVWAKIPFIGRLPGDIFIQRKNVSFYFPLTTSILLSLVISFILWAISKR
ncbi:MAG: DUF2905 domain-containing protein [Candidatus Omnitrophota bacterium]